VSAQSDAFVDAAAELAAAVAASASDPADAIRLLLPLATWGTETPPPKTTATAWDNASTEWDAVWDSVPLPPRQLGPLAQNARALSAAFADTLRTAACAALGAATQAYRPTSYQDAIALRKTVCDVIDRQAMASADAGRDETFRALRDLRTFVALDLAIRGANLAWLVEIRTQASTPSLTEAWTLYQDTTREPSIVASSDVRHPLWMPIEFEALTR